MEHSTVLVIMIVLFYLQATITLVGGVYLLFSGVKQFSKRENVAQRLSWDKYPPILHGFWAIFMGIFFCLATINIIIDTSESSANWVIKMLLFLAAAICFGIAMFCLFRARHYATLLPPKRRRLKQSQPKE